MEEKIKEEITSKTDDAGDKKDRVITDKELRK